MAVGFRRWSLRSLGVDYGLVAGIIMGIEDHWGTVGMEVLGSTAFD